jgi:hypothetical protein
MKRVIRLTESELKSIIKKAIQEDAVLFRKMTLKSKIMFGKFNGLSVEEIIRLGRRSYLRYLYYNIEGLTFMDDVLKIIGIISPDDFIYSYNYTIPKPGKDPEYGKEVEELQIKKYSFDVKSHYKRKLKARAIGKKIVDAKKFSKQNLTWKNQGHR